ncbi:MAG: ankyrin repeat domain-containing protein [Alphaproteobacteria bacterium]|nr:MAG: ankyrin repeat domain-containing protein [Alphaproteobacteria bacterium]
MKDLSREQKEALGRMIVEGCKKGDADVVEGCLKRGADPDVSVCDGDGGPRKPALHWAAYNFNEKCMQALIGHGANLEARDGDGETALFYAIRNFKVPAVEFLMKNGADPLAQSNNKTVALDVARNLRTDYASYSQARDQIIKALTKDYGQAPEKPPPVQDDVASPATQEDIHVLKPITLQPKKGGHGFNL